MGDKLRRIYELKLSRTKTYVSMDSIAPYNEQAIECDIDVAYIMRKLVGQSPREHFFSFYVDNKNRIAGFECLGIGAGHSVTIHPAELLRSVLVSGCSAFIVAHNHPSESVQPSEDDITLTSNLIDACKIVGIKLLDHVIVTSTDCYSFARQNNKTT
jgi:DNA repair protein RadC